MNITIDNPTTPFLQSKRNQAFGHLWNMHKCLVLIILILMIGFVLLVLGIVMTILIVKYNKTDCTKREKIFLEEQRKLNEMIDTLENDLCEKNKKLARLEDGNSKE